jgi:hypothetical protein
MTEKETKITELMGTMDGNIMIVQNYLNAECYKEAKEKMEELKKNIKELSNEWVNF